MKKTALFILTMTFAAGAYAAELKPICAAGIKADFTGDIPAPSIARVYSGPTGTSVCETAIARSLNFRPTVFRDIKNQPLRGFDKAYYTEQGPMQVALVLQTKKEAFYYYEDCDICAEIDKCDLKTGVVSRVVAAHSADCSDIAKFSAGAVYNACAKPVAACARVGEDVRIPDECCSANAVPNQNGEMTCVEAVPAGSTCARIGDDVRIPDECCSGSAAPNQGGEMTCVENIPALPVTPVTPAVTPGCSKVGEDVRIPEECCSRNAEPNQGGEMTCVEAVPAGSNCAKIGDAVRIPAECCSGNAVPAYGGEMECVEAARIKSPFAR